MRQFYLTGSSGHQFTSFAMVTFFLEETMAKLIPDYRSEIESPPLLPVVALLAEALCVRWGFGG